MKEGSAFYLWYYPIPGKPPVPLGVYDDPPPEDLPLVLSKRIGSSRAASYARTLTDAADELGDFLQRLNPLN